MTRLMLTGGLLAGIFLVAGAHAQGRSCAPRALVVDRLAEGYGESRHAIGIAASDQLVELFASPDTGTWTITATDAAGLTCLIASGESFEAVTESLPDTGDPA